MFQKNVRLARFSNYKIGGEAEYFFEAKNAGDVHRALCEWRRLGRTSEEIFVLGGGTNILFGDHGFRGLVIRPALTELRREGNEIRAGAGVLVADLLGFAAQEGLSGLEWAGGLPGTLGGAIRGNAGAFGGETKDLVREVKSADFHAEDLKIMRRSYEECAFGYRDSIFKQRGGEIILEAVLRFLPGNPAEIREIAEARKSYRRERHPIEYPNVGSIFKNVDVAKITEKNRMKLSHVIKQDPFPVVPAAYLIAEAGVRGVSTGGAMISPKHPNFIVNVQSAAAKDVRNLIALVKGEIREKFGIELEEEVLIF